jgi:hypothetical protein
VLTTSQTPDMDKPDIIPLLGLALPVGEPHGAAMKRRLLETTTMIEAETAAALNQFSGQKTYAFSGTRSSRQNYQNPSNSAVDR